MKGMKGKFLKKMKSIKPPIAYLKTDRILQVNAADGYVESFLKNPLILKVQTQLFCKDTDQQHSNNKTICQTSVARRQELKEEQQQAQEPDVIDVSELMKDLEDEEEEDKIDSGEDSDDKENTGPAVVLKENSKDCVLQEGSRMSALRKEVVAVPVPRDPMKTPLSEIDVLSFRRPDSNSTTLFDPNLLAAFEEAVKDHVKISEEERRPGVDENEPPSKSRRISVPGCDLSFDVDDNPLLAFEERCPPGGRDYVVFYTTSLRGIRKTFEDCTGVRFLLESFRVSYYERDVSMHSEYREELWALMEGKAVPPRLFVKGRYIGGADQVLGLHEQGKLRPLFDGIPINKSTGPCENCAGFRFGLCSNCNGSHRIVGVGVDGLSSTCPKCNENGLVVCPSCC